MWQLVYRKQLVRCACVLAAALWITGAGAQNPPDQTDPLEVEFSIHHANKEKAPKAPFVEGEIVGVQFKVRDRISKIPIQGRYPSSWINLRSPNESQGGPTCEEQIQQFLNASIFSRPTVDLNTYNVLAMNNDASITVVDPLFSYGNTKMLALVPLRSPGKDWALLDGPRPLVFVSMPASGQIAVIDASRWLVAENIDVGSGVDRISLQPDGHYLWAFRDSSSNSEDSQKVAVIDTLTLRVVGQVPLEAGLHEIAFSSEGGSVFIANRKAGTVSVINTRTLAVERTIPIGREAASIAFSSKSQMAYVTDPSDGIIAALNGSKNSPAAIIKAEPGVRVLRFAPEGRFAVVLNPDRKKISVLDSATNRIVQRGEVEYAPARVAFSSTLAYISQHGSGSVLTLPLDDMGTEGKPISVGDFPGGQHPMDDISDPSPADGIIRAPGDNAVLVANPSDRAVYYYMEGAAATQGSFSNYGREPRAILALDRTLRQTAPGVYETTVRLDRAGSYTVAFFLDSPRAVKCWDLPVETDSEAEKSAGAGVAVESMLAFDSIVPGTPVKLRFRLRDVKTKEPQSGARDVTILAYRAPGVWQQREHAQAGDDGVYEADFVAPQPGTYVLHLQSPSLGLLFQSNSFVIVAAK